MSAELEASTGSESVSVEGHEAVTAAVIKERRRYSSLELARSAYDNVLASFLKSDRGRLYCKPWWLLVLNFLAQYVVVYLLWQRNVADSVEAGNQLLKQAVPGDPDQSLCFLVGKDNAHYTKGMEGISCTPDEVSLLMDFKQLDMDGDDVWTYREAQQLDAAYTASTGRYVNIGEVYKKVFWLFKRATESSPDLVLPCNVNDTVEAFQDDGFWHSADIEGVGSGETAYVWLHIDEWTTVPWKRLRKKVGDVYFRCSLPKCIDLDNGAKDSEGSSCFDYNDWHGECSEGRFDDDDFQVKELCCICGGGSSSLALTGISHLPINQSLNLLSQAAEFRTCIVESMDVNDQDVCLQNFTFLPKEVYNRELAPFLGYCVLPEKDLCGNLAANGTLPAPQFQISYSVPILFKKMKMNTLDDFDPQTLCERAVSFTCPEIFTVRSTHFQEEREDICGQKTSLIDGYLKTVTYEASETYSDPRFGLTSIKFRMFLLLIVFLWGLAAVEEFRLIIVWWNVLLSLPTRALGEPCLVGKVQDEDDQGSLEICGLHRRSRWIVIFLNLLPRTVLQCLVFGVGIQYLLAVRNVSDLILNSLALTFLITVDEMLFEAFASETDGTLIQRCNRMVGRSCPCVDSVLKRTHTTVGVWIFIPILVALCYGVIDDVSKTLIKANATYCLCDIEGQGCLASRLLSTAAP